MAHSMEYSIGEVVVWLLGKNGKWDLIHADYTSIRKRTLHGYVL